MTSFQTGDILEWQGCPVLVLGPPNKGYGQQSYRTVVYLSVKPPVMLSPGDPCPSFNIEGKGHYTRKLTEEETTLYTKMMLLYGR